MTATSVVPPPMSTIMFPVGSATGRPAPIAAAIGSSMRYAWRAPAESVASSTARFSTPVTPDGHADDHARVRPAVLVHLLDEVAEHLLGDVEVGDDAVLQRPDRGDVAGRAAEHALGLDADGVDLAGALVDGDHRRLGEHDAAAADVDERVGGAEVDGHVTAAEPSDGSEEADDEHLSVTVASDESTKRLDSGPARSRERRGGLGVDRRPTPATDRAEAGGGGPAHLAGVLAATCPRLSSARQTANRPLS